ncbi:beta clamp domain-containing protein [Pararhizobium mangrovi]|nr:hypothetical protein [Pararhizobium mangrovi]
MVRMDANLFRLVATVQGRDFTRYNLNGVHIEPAANGGCIMVATDGHRMLVAHDPEGECVEPVIVKLPRFSFAQCKHPKMMGARRELMVDADARSATITEITKVKDQEDNRETILTAYDVLIDGVYPDWRGVVPSGSYSGTPGSFTGFNPAYLKEWSFIGTELAKTRGAVPGIAIQQTAEHAPTLIRWTGVEEIFGIQMPMRIDVRAALPPFMDQPAEKVAA